MPSQIEMFLASGLLVDVGAPLLTARPQDIERAISGDPEFGSQPDNVRAFGRFTLGGEEPVEQRYRDGLVEYRDTFELLQTPQARPTQFPAKITGSVNFSTTRYKYSWKEVVWNTSSNSFFVKTNGRTSTYAGSDFGRPAWAGIEPIGNPFGLTTPIPNDLIVEMHEEKRAGYILYWFEGEAVTTGAVPDVVQGVITAVHGTTNATYDVAGVQNPLLTMTNQVPRNREFATGVVSYPPATVGSSCLILIGVGITDVQEKLPGTSCPA